MATGPEHGQHVLHAVRRLILGDLELGGDLPIGPAGGDRPDQIAFAHRTELQR